MLFDAHGTYFEKNQTPARITSSLQRAKNLLLINYSLLDLINLESR